MLLRFGQTETASISGMVGDASEGGVDEAQVQVRNSATGSVRETKADASGYYKLNLLPPGTYSVRVQAPGFKGFLDESVQVNVAQPLLLNVRLEIGSVTESVQVSGKASLLNTESASQEPSSARRKSSPYP